MKKGIIDLKKKKKQKNVVRLATTHTYFNKDLLLVQFLK